MRPLILAALVLAGCAHAETHHVPFQEAAPRGPGAADLYLQSVPSRPYTELGLVQVIHHGGDSEAATLDALRAEGRRRGCDAVAKVQVQAGLTASHALGVCVRWLGP